MGAAAADHPIDLAPVRRPAKRRHRRRGGVAHPDIGHQFGDRGADLGPVRLGIVARPPERLLQGAEPLLISQRR